MSQAPPMLRKQLAEVLVFLRNGEFFDAKQELRTIQYCAKHMTDSDNYWDNMEDGVTYFINWINREMREGREDGFTKEEDKQFQEDVHRVVNGEKPRHFDVDTDELRLSPSGLDSELVEATEAVKQDQIEFLEEEIRKSEEHLMELKQELNELQSESD